MLLLFQFPCSNQAWPPLKIISRMEVHEERINLYIIQIRTKPNYFVYKI